MAQAPPPAALRPVDLSSFRNEPFTKTGDPEQIALYRAALAGLRRELGREYPNLIGFPAREVRCERKLQSLNPSAPSEVVAIHQEGTPELARDAVAAAERAFESWKRTSFDERADLLQRVAQILRRRKLEFCALMALEVGKTFPEADADAGEAIDFAEYYALLARRLGHPEPLPQLPGERDELLYLPLGVGAVIPPWNFPLAIMAGMAMAAVVAGNTVVLKPSSDSPTIAARFMEVLAEAGLPSGVVQFVTGGGDTVGGTLVEDARVRFISFTGSRAVGLLVNQRAALSQPGQRWIKRTILEMGGKDAILVDADADLDAAAEGVTVSAFNFQGQKCSACSRAVVHEAIYDEFLRKLIERAGKLRLGLAEDPSVNLGPVVSERAYKKILSYIAVGKQEGRLVLGGEPQSSAAQGYFIPPTIFADIAPQARIAQEEIFGPVLAVIRCRDFDHGLEIVNGTEYGLTGAVYTRNAEKWERAKRDFHVGNLYWNRKCTGAMVGAHPFGGFNMSGTDSKAGGPDYLLLFTQAKSVAARL